MSVAAAAFNVCLIISSESPHCQYFLLDGFNTQMDSKGESNRDQTDRHLWLQYNPILIWFRLNRSHSFPPRCSSSLWSTEGKREESLSLVPAPTSQLQHWHDDTFFLSSPQLDSNPKFTFLSHLVIHSKNANCWVFLNTAPKLWTEQVWG